MKRFLFWRRGQQAGDGQGSPPSDDSRLLTGDPVEDQRSVQILLDTIAAVTANIDLETVLRDIVDRSLMVTKAERAVLFLGSTPDDLVVRVGRDKDGNALPGDFQVSRSVLRRCLGERMAVKSVVQSDQEALELGQSVFDLKLRAVMCAPLIARDRLIGAIYVDSRAVRREFTTRDLALFGAITDQLAISVENARLYADSLEKMRLQKDVELARRIQTHLLTQVPRNVPGVDLAVRFRAAGHASGDVYDIMPLRDGRVAVMIGDVTGHGVGAALLTHAVQAALRSYLELIDDLSEVVTRLNDRLVHGVETGNFMSLLLAIVDPAGRRLRYVNAGHPGLVHVGSHGATVLDKTGMVLGVVAGQRYEVSAELALQPGDVLFLRTDGVDECMSPERELFGEARLQQSLHRARAGTADQILDALSADLASHSRGQEYEDDIAMLAVKLT